MGSVLSKVCVFLYRIPSDSNRILLRKAINYFDGGQSFSENLRYVMKKYHGFEIGIGSYGSCFDPQKFYVGNGNLKVGKYTSIAQNVCAYTRNHPYWKPSTFPLFYNASFNKKIKSDTVAYGKLEIGNDVWIGQYAIILPSCHRIGDGAVIGAGAIVTKDVPDYAIVAGNPAKVLKFRFDNETISLLKEIQWWNWEYNDIIANIDSFNSIEDLKLILDRIKK